MDKLKEEIKQIITQNQRFLNKREIEIISEKIVKHISKYIGEENFQKPF